MRAMFLNKALKKLLVFLEGILYSGAVGAAIEILDVNVFSLHCSCRPEWQRSQHTSFQCLRVQCPVTPNRLNQMIKCQNSHSFGILEIILIDVSFVGVE